MFRQWILNARFSTGATGYIGGDILHEIVANFPRSSIIALVRDKAKAAPIEEKYSQVTLLQGDLDSASLIEDQAARADVVITLWLQISGASLLSVPDIKHKSFGEASEKVYDDLVNTDEIRQLIDTTSSRTVDQAILNFARSHATKVKTALIFPPIIYGLGCGQGNKRSIQIPTLCNAAIKQHESIFVGRGEARWGNVHVADLSGLIGKLTEAGLDSDSPEHLWNENGIYFPATGEITWKSIAGHIAQAAGKRNIEARVESITAEQADQFSPHGSVLFGTNARSKPSRGHEFLKYKATQHTLEDEIPITFARELEITDA
ncbi:hypothetical protein D6D28_02461 [Aureobasidium pullulans]|uniref:NAD(P)-binding domain-containing protein n=1 Tax=Aureobasidium pullulans TaxID=5580 RepID=A0A4S8SUK1_AURPU|nr:hypothetical protein D6D28_02461 [Aureobasidium pullulans]